MDYFRVQRYNKFLIYASKNEKKFASIKKKLYLCGKFKRRKDMTQEQKDRLRDIINAGAKGMTADVRAFVRGLAEENGIEIKNTRCKDCHLDAAVALLRLDREKDASAETEENDDRRYVLRPGVDVYFGSVRVNAETLTDDLAERIIARGFEKKNFVKC